jgi:glutamate dehydrogenase
LLVGAAAQHFRLGEQRSPKQPVLALYTPDFDRHGWHSPHTVIDVVTDDMPFLVDSISMLVYRRGLAIHRLLHPLLSVGRGPAGGTLQQTLPRGAWPAGQPPNRGFTSRSIASVTAASDRRSAAGDWSTFSPTCAPRSRTAPPCSSACTMPRAMLRRSAARATKWRTICSWIATNNFVFLGYAEYFVRPLSSTP